MSLKVGSKVSRIGIASHKEIGMDDGLSKSLQKALKILDASL